MATRKRHEITDEQWERIKQFFPPEQGKGRPFRSHRTMVNSIFWVLSTGAPWRDLPERYGPWQTAYNRFNRWRKEGLIDRLLQKLRFQLDENGHIDWSLWCIDGSNIRAHVSSAGAGKKGDYLNQETTLWVVQEADLAPKFILSLMEEEPL